MKTIPPKRNWIARAHTLAPSHRQDTHDLERDSIFFRHFVASQLIEIACDINLLIPQEEFEKLMGQLLIGIKCEATIFLNQLMWVYRRILFCVHYALLMPTNGN